MSTLADLIAVLDAAYPPELAEPWDAVGLVCGDPADEVRDVLLAVDATEAVVDDALDRGVQALVVHHPLLLRGVHGVGADTVKGALVHRLVRGGCALFTAHTNADRADPGVSDALAGVLGLQGLSPVEPEALGWDKLITTVPVADADRLIDALFAAGAGQVGAYSEVAFRSVGRGQFRPGRGTHPTIGAPGVLEQVDEQRIELALPREQRSAVVAALLAAHPYEEPVYDVLTLAERPGRRGLGRVGELARAESLRTFTARAATALPRTAWGVRAAGDPGRSVHRVAVCGGAGDGLLEVVAGLGVDAYVTADLRHHPADEHLRAGGPALVDVAHWASEQPWCGQAQAVIERGLPGTVTARVSSQRTDPWTLGAGGTGTPEQQLEAPE
ncbi:MAG: Nif3-like dinuclear metal center hexameric protein [Mycobacteriaceae bacterium]